VGQLIEQVGRVGADRLVAGEHPNVFINLGGHGIVISRGKVDLAADAVPHFADNQGDLAV
jgi:hypothetical protein